MNNETIKNLTFFRFEDLRIYQKSINYVYLIDEITKTFPEKYNDLRIKFNSSARDITMNIAEGSSRNKSQFIFYLKMAKTAIRSCVIFTTISLRINLITTDQEEKSINELKEMTKMVGALITSLQKNKDETNYNNFNND